MRCRMPHILVVDDGSNDGTAGVARRAGAQVVQMPFNVGVGGAMRTAFLFAQRNGFEAVVQVDADGQHVPAHIPELLAALDHASVAVGARFADGYEVHGPRRWAMHTLARSLSRVCDAPLTDTTSGFRAADRRRHRAVRPALPRRVPRGHRGVAGPRRTRRAAWSRRYRFEMLPRQGGRPSQSAVQSLLYLGRALLALYVALSRKPILVADAPSMTAVA